MLMSEAHKRKLDLVRADKIDQWRQTRLISFLIAKSGDLIRDKNMSQYDFYPLPDDPTAEQIAQSAKEDNEKSGKWMKGIIERFRKHKIQ